MKFRWHFGLTEEEGHGWVLWRKVTERYQERTVLGNIVAHVNILGIEVSDYQTITIAYISPPRTSGLITETVAYKQRDNACLMPLEQFFMNTLKTTMNTLCTTWSVQVFQICCLDVLNSFRMTLFWYALLMSRGIDISQNIDQNAVAAILSYQTIISEKLSYLYTYITSDCDIWTNDCNKKSHDM